MTPADLRTSGCCGFGPGEEVGVVVEVPAGREVGLVEVAGQRADARKLGALQTAGQAEQQRGDGAEDVAAANLGPRQLTVAAVLKALRLDRKAQVVVAGPDQLAVGVEAGACVEAVSFGDAVLELVEV